MVFEQGDSNQIREKTINGIATSTLLSGHSAAFARYWNQVKYLLLSIPSQKKAAGTFLFVELPMPGRLSILPPNPHVPVADAFPHEASQIPRMTPCNRFKTRQTQGK